MAGGDGHYLALRDDGTVVAWDHLGAVRGHVRADRPVVQIAAGMLHAVLLQDDGTVAAFDEPGPDNFGARSFHGATGVTHIGAGAFLTLVGYANGTIAWSFAGQPTPVSYLPPGELAQLDATWGTAYVRLANGTLLYEANPTLGPGRSFLSMSVGLRSGLAVLASGRLLHWYEDIYNITTQGYWEVHADDGASAEGIVQLAAGFRFALALAANGSVYGFGDAVMPAVLQEGVVSVGAAIGNGMAQLEDGRVVVWDVSTGSLGVVPEAVTARIARTSSTVTPTSRTSSATFTRTASLSATTTASRISTTSRTRTTHAARSFKTMTGGASHFVALRVDGTVVAWDTSGNLLGSIGGYRPVVEIAAGFEHTVLLEDDGTVRAFGYLGEFNGAANVSKIGAGVYQTIIMRKDGSLAWRDDSQHPPPGLRGADVAALGAAWGASYYLMRNGTLFVNYLTDLVPYSVREMAIGWRSGMGILNTGRLLYWYQDIVWFFNDSLSAEGIVDLAAGDHFGLALAENGTVYGFENVVVPAAVSDGFVVAIGAGKDHGIAQLDDGSLVVWNRTTGHLVPVPSAVNSRTRTRTASRAALPSDAGVTWTVSASSSSTITPTTTTTPATVRKILTMTGGLDHFVALVEDGSVVAWDRSGNLRSDISVPRPATAIAAGDNHTVVLLDDRSVRVFGGVGSDAQEVALIGAGGNNTVYAFDDGRFFNALPDQGPPLEAYFYPLAQLATDGATTYYLLQDGRLCSPYHCNVGVGYDKSVIAAAVGGCLIYGVRNTPSYGYNCNYNGPWNRYVWNQPVGSDPNVAQVATAYGLGLALTGGGKMDGFIMPGKASGPPPGLVPPFLAIGGSPKHGMVQLANGTVVVWGFDPVSGRYTVPVPDVFGPGWKATTTRTPSSSTTPF